MTPPFTPPALPDFTQRTSFSFKELAHSSSDAIITASMGPGPYHNIRQGAIYRIEAVMQDFRERIVYSMRDETPVFDDRETWSDLHEEIYRECFEPPRESLETDPYLAVRVVGQEMRVTCGFIIDLSDEHHRRFLHFRGHRGIVWYLDLVSDSFAECEALWEMIQKRYFVMSGFPETSTGEQNK